MIEPTQATKTATGQSVLLECNVRDWMIKMNKRLDCIIFRTRCWLVKKLIGKCSVIANIDWVGKIILRGDFMLSENSVALDPIWQQGKSVPERSPMCETPCKKGN